MRYAFCLIFVLIGSSFSVIPAQGIVRGKVFDNSTLEPLYGVYIIYGSKGTTTDTDGSYLIEPDSGNQILHSDSSATIPKPEPSTYHPMTLLSLMSVWK